MMQLVQSVRDGTLRLVTHQAGSPTPSQISVITQSSLISSGTERSTHELAGSSLLQKAKSRPDLVRAVIDRTRIDGLRRTLETVRARLDENMPVGYSAAGVVDTVGEAVAGLRPGDRVATAGAGHAEIQIVPGNLAAKLPDGVSFDEGAFGAIASVALHGLRLGETGPGSRVVVIGLGLIGQLATRLALATGCHVAGTDLDPSKIALAGRSGAQAFDASPDGLEAAWETTQGRGFDAVLVTAASKSSEPMQMAVQLARDRSTIVAIGDVGLDLDRRSLYEKELTVKVSRSYGLGRYEPSYEQLGIDYPIGLVRWTIGRNLEAVMSLIASGQLEVKDLITHRFPFDQAVDAYDVFDEDELYLGILLGYGDGGPDATPVTLRHTAIPRQPGERSLAAGLIGAGRFASQVLLPNATAAGFGPWRRIHSATGTSAVLTGEKFGFDQAVAVADDVIGDPDADTVFVATRHDSHAEFVLRALEAGKNVFCEKPLAITETDLAQIEAAWQASSTVLMVGFNRRWSPAIVHTRRHLGTRSPIQIMYRVHAGELPPAHWLRDRRQGGRLLGEACHFIDTCNALAGESPRAVYAVASGGDETLLREDFAITLDYPSGSHAMIVYSSGSPRGAGKERLEVMSGDRSAVVEGFRTLTLRSSTVDVAKYRPADKGHAREFMVFREAIEGKRDQNELAETAIATSRAALAAVESLMTGSVVRLD
jgi:predicted dehydrogenase/threonine dehydrogenase-like Zn-dependent dehydrogenase